MSYSEESLSGEPKLDELLENEICRRLMACDGLDLQSVYRVSRAAADRLAQQSTLQRNSRLAA